MIRRISLIVCFLSLFVLFQETAHSGKYIPDPQSYDLMTDKQKEDAAVELLFYMIVPERQGGVQYQTEDGTKFKIHMGQFAKDIDRISNPTAISQYENENDMVTYDFESERHRRFMAGKDRDPFPERYSQFVDMTHETKAYYEKLEPLRAQKFWGFDAKDAFYTVEDRREFRNPPDPLKYLELLSHRMGDRMDDRAIRHRDLLLAMEHVYQKVPDRRQEFFEKFCSGEPSIVEKAIDRVTQADLLFEDEESLPEFLKQPECRPLSAVVKYQRPKAALAASPDEKIEAACRNLSDDTFDNDKLTRLELAASVVLKGEYIKDQQGYKDVEQNWNPEFISGALATIQSKSGSQTLFSTHRLSEAHTYCSQSNSTGFLNCATSYVPKFALNKQWCTQLHNLFCTPWSEERFMREVVVDLEEKALTREKEKKEAEALKPPQRREEVVSQKPSQFWKNFRNLPGNIWDALTPESQPAKIRRWTHEKKERRKERQKKSR
ncbi:MAG: hypothetical protein HYW47_05340 [Deltaproteobacteria bacterium]|nr:hypothetical protein [Deltaproteobacteria bacterium]